MVNASMLLPNDLDQHPLRPIPIELAAENLLPRPEVEFPLGKRHDLPAHELPLQVGVGVVLAGSGLNGGNSSCYLRKSWCKPHSSSLMNTLVVISWRRPADKGEARI